MIELEMHDSNGDTGSYGTTNPAGGPNIDTVFAGAVFFKISGS
jgi:hypothetical protein